MSAVAIFVKTPGLSPVKTRLAAGIGAEAARAFHLAAAAAVASVVRQCHPELVPSWAVAEPDTSHWDGFPTLWQGEGGLGERMQSVYARLLARHGRVLLIGADAPQITPTSLLAASRSLNDTPYVLGPAQDGGFWLFGGRLPVPSAVWTGTPYSAPRTCAMFAQGLRRHGQISFVDEFADTDRPEDLPPLRASLRALAHPTPEQTALAVWLTENEAFAS